MKIITKISQTHKYPDLYLLTFENGVELYTSFEGLQKFKIVKGIELNDEIYTSIENDSPYITMRSEAFRKAALKESTGKDIENYLRRKKLPPIYIDKIIQELKNKNYINEERYAKKYISRSQLSTKPKGRNAVLYEMLQKGVSSETANQLAEDINKEDLLEYSKKYIQKSTQKDNKNLKNKLIRHLVSRGFDYETIIATVDSLFRDQ